MKSKIIIFRLLILAASVFLFLEGAGLFTSIFLFLAIDYAIYLHFKQHLETEQANKEFDQIALSLAAIADRAEEGFIHNGKVIGKYNDGPIYEQIRNKETGETLHFVGTIVHNDADNMIQNMMINNGFIKAVRLENGLIYAIKKETLGV